MGTGTLKQILLLTDGCSNEGGDPSAIAALAREQQVTVNVIGVLEEGAMNESGQTEIENIALAGGGISQIVYKQQLAQTVQMVTKQAMTQTLQGVVNQELSQILGKEQEWDELPPEKRGEVMEVVDEIGEKVDLEVAILVDSSASMRMKLPTVQEALIDLSLSMASRGGSNRFTLLAFPGKKKDVDVLCEWTKGMDQLDGIFQKITPGGITPTGPALKATLNQFEKLKKRSLISRGEETFFEERSS
ncbi:Ca-activated chloride channel family protein [Geomicrobium halophilum]|uniref:Ca-activated chloride channel family protein n=1 Tax=Geomicrobium halophilum TaxID=549000 RepID=A0A841PV04_9BACL|nr:VWA domain-containing protein [Geomicrobium halophilum]MBB6451554.1 Ca-activated chloride channel family protein [Geomicrobium halophilum]